MLHFWKCRPTAPCRRSGTRILTRSVSARKKNRFSTCIFFRNQAAPPKPPPRTPNKKNGRASFHRRGYLSKNAREPPLVPSFYPLPSLCQAFSSTLRTVPRSCFIPGMSTWPEPPAIWQKNGGKSCRINHPRGAGKHHNFTECPITRATISCIACGTTQTLRTAPTRCGCRSCAAPGNTAQAIHPYQ